MGRKSSTPAYVVLIGVVFANPAFGQDAATLSPLLSSLGSRLSSVSALPDPPSVPATRFRPSSGRLTLTAFVNGAAPDPAGRQNIRTLLESVFSAYESAAEKGGMANDLAGALAFYIGANYTAYSGGAEIDDAGSARIVHQIRSALETPPMRAAPDSEKQQLYETHIMLAGLLGARQELAKGDAAATNALRALGAEGLKLLLKVDPSRVKITEEGLRITPIGGAAPPAKTGSVKTLLFTAPAPWTRKDHVDGISLNVNEEVYLSRDATCSVVLTGALPPAGSLQKSFHRYWGEQVLSLMKGSDRPFAMVGLRSGLRYAFAERVMETKAAENRLRVIYMLFDGGASLYPVLILQSETFGDSKGHLDRFLSTLRIPGGAPPAKPLALNADLARNWSTTASSVTNYVHAYTGANAGTSVVAYRQSYSMKPDGTYTGSFLGMNNSSRIRTSGKGTYRLQGDLLIFKESNGRTIKQRFLGIDVPPGATGPIMLLLNPAYPTNAANIGLYGEKYGVVGK